MSIKETRARYIIIIDILSSMCNGNSAIHTPKIKR